MVEESSQSCVASCHFGCGDLLVLLDYYLQTLRQTCRAFALLKTIGLLDIVADANADQNR